MITPLTKNWNIFSRTGPFLMVLGALESNRQSASYAFGFIKKYLFFEKLEPKTFCVMFFITRFSEFFHFFFKPKILRKNVFGKSTFSIWKFFFRFFDFLKIEMSIFGKLFFLSKFSGWKNIFWKIFFSENRVMKNVTQKVFGSNFSKNKYFLINPKAYEADWRLLSNAPKTKSPARWQISFDTDNSKVILRFLQFTDDRV